MSDKLQAILRLLAHGPDFENHSLHSASYTVGVESKVFVERWLLSWGLKGEQDVSWGWRGGRAEGTARGRMTQDTKALLSSSSMWGLPLQFDFVGF